MNTADLIEVLAASDEKLTKGQAKALVDSLFKAVADAAARGDEINLPGFGKFKVQAKPARTGRNPSTGESIQIAASKKLTFQPAKALKEAVNS